MNAHLAILPGDGIGRDVTLEAVRVLRVVEECYGHRLECDEAPIGGCAFDATGTTLPEDTLALCREADAILFGAVGGPTWENLPTEQRPERALAAVRKEFDFYVNLRPIRGRKALAPVLPVKESLIGEGFEFLIVRELAGGLYYGEPHGVEAHPTGRRGYNMMTYTTAEVERVARAAFELARKRSKRVTSVAKENMLETSLVWREVATKVAEDYPDVALNHILIDACAYHLIRNPSAFDVIVTENLFGDILSDEGGALVGSLGMCPSASYGDSAHGLYEPVHGTAPDIAGKGIANPLGAILSAALLLRHSLGLETEAKAVEDAVERALEDGYRTEDIRQAGWKVVWTIEMTDSVIERLRMA